MIKQLKQKPLYFITLLTLLALLILGSLLFSRQESFVFLNSYHHWLPDLFFINFTWFGDGTISIAAVILLAAFRKRKEAITLLLAYAGSGIIAQVLKHWFHAPRPLLYFGQTGFHFKFINNIVIYKEFSFPSGHTVSAFALATVFALCFSNKRIGMLALLLALLEGFSRIYLGEHFLIDVTAGMMIGMISAMLSYHIMSLKQLPKIARILKRKKPFDSNNDAIKSLWNRQSADWQEQF